MRQVIRFLFTFLLVFSGLPASAMLQGNINYNPPIDYSQLNIDELEQKADFYYNLALKTSIGNINNDMTNALILFNILNNKCLNNQVYAIKLGILYDLTSNDRLAKSCFYRAISIDETKPSPYFYLGEFYYKRQSYRQALKFYKQAFERGYSQHYETLYKLGDVYQKLGDTTSSLKYWKLAFDISPNDSLENKIKCVELANKRNLFNK